MEIRIYALSTCPYCRMARRFLDESGVTYEVTEVDTLEGDEKDTVVAEVKRLSGGVSFPVIVAGEQVIVGYDKGRISAALGL